MIFSIMRFGVLGLIVMTILYALIRYYITSRMREEFEGEYASEARATTKTDWVSAKMAGYTCRLRLVAFLLSYVLPSIVVAIVVYLVNYA